MPHQQPERAVTTLRRPRLVGPVVDRGEAMAAMSVPGVRMVLVVARPGAGKTHLLAQWHDTIVGAGWLTLTERDRDPSVFWHGLGAALSEAGAVAEVTSLVRLVD